MRFVKALVFIFVLTFCLVSTALAKSKIKDYDLGIGIGIPYGGLGGNIEIGREYLFTAGLGIVPFTDASIKNTQIGWCTGLRFYFKQPVLERVRWRASFLYGTVAYTEKNYLNTIQGGTIKEYQLQTGFAPSIGLRGENWDFDLAYSMYNVPEGETKRGSDIMFSFGLRF